MHVVLRLDDEERPREHDVWVTRTEATVELEVDGERYEATVARREDGTVLVDLGDHAYEVQLAGDRDALIDGRRFRFELPRFEPGGAPGEHETFVQGDGAVFPPMPGKILEVHVEEGDEVELDDDLAVLEAMKMQSTITAPRAGTVLRVHAAPGEAVEGRDLLFEIGDEE